ncbi:hypothetical protein EHQ12_04240 [Leptospira gomenensis]|uniref:Uncharacterized protein n=1 Tax=Leptospira gomenensis TaxID=2484974 RepID=A0A5F1YDU1_9LEPT|nr:hypothetical protein EHQ17_04475 [Leptospira gomenensis]TGK42784.1 hypothetical protein EHQ07_14015 [Leptospira gomenensis]TGK42973.1 hypothetical protein EHQ12_04240 [Leptospira gomenensis]TGK54928.1 hypothetical protein EHQ13_18185 [Leptospira gomenensis]
MKAARIRKVVDLIDDETQAIIQKDFLEPTEELYGYEEGEQGFYRARFSDDYKNFSFPEFEKIEYLEIECLWNESSLIEGSKIVKGKRAPFTFRLNGNPVEIPDNGYFAKSGGVSSIEIRPADPTSISETEEKEVRFRILLCAK